MEMSNVSVRRTNPDRPSAWLEVTSTATPTTAGTTAGCAHTDIYCQPLPRISTSADRTPWDNRCFPSGGRRPARTRYRRLLRGISVHWRTACIFAVTVWTASKQACCRITRPASPRTPPADSEDVTDTYRRRRLRILLCGRTVRRD